MGYEFVLDVRMERLPVIPLQTCPRSRALLASTQPNPKLRALPTTSPRLIFKLSQVIHEGQLLKKGDWRWHKRFCVLDGLYFRVFNDKGELKPK